MDCFLASVLAEVIQWKLALLTAAVLSFGMDSRRTLEFLRNKILLDTKV